MADPTDPADPHELLRPLRRVRQVREFTDEPPSDAALEAIADVGRWSGSSRNTQPWRFLILRDRALLRRICEIGLPQTRALRTATAAIAIVLPAHDTPDVGDVYDDGRAAEVDYDRRVEHVAHLAVLDVAGKYEYLHGSSALLQPSNRLDGAGAGHFDVHHYERRLKPLRLPQRGIAVLDLANHFEVVVLIE